MRRLFIALIKAYSWLISPLMGQSCRFHPTCSAYAVQAIESHGVIKGCFLMIKRLLKCHPWHRGAMIDPVPEKNSKKHSTKHSKDHCHKAP